MANNDTLSLTKMLNALPNLRLSTASETIKEDSPPPPPTPRGGIPPPGFTKQNQPLLRLCGCGFCTYLNPQEPDEKRLQWMFNLMTNSQEDGAYQFKELISTLDRRELLRMTSFLTSDSNYFMAIARNEYGSRRLQKLLGKSDDVDTFFFAAIMPLFLHVMTNKNASYVAVRGMRVFNEDKKEPMYERILLYALDLARNQYGCIALNEIITDLDHPYYRNQLLDILSHNALRLSNDAYGNFVIQHVLKLHDFRCTVNIAVKLCGHCVDLSFQKKGSYIVERLLEATEETMVVVVLELLKCEGGRLVRLARSDFGNFVVAKALRTTKQMSRINLFWDLVEMLMPFLHLLRRSRGSNIAAILESVKLSC